MRNAGLDEAQAGIKIAGRNIKNLRYADDTTWTEVYWSWREGDKERRCWRPSRNLSASGKDEQGTEGIFRVWQMQKPEAA